MWGKTDLNGLSRARGGPAWNPLLAHCLDAAAVCGELFDRYLSAPVRARLADDFGGGDVRTARKVLMLLVALHDMPGKAWAGFQIQFSELGDRRDPRLRAAGLRWLAAARAAGLPVDDWIPTPAPPHAHVTARYLPALLGCPGSRCTGTGRGTHEASAPTLCHPGLHTAAAILGGHHGHVPPAGRIKDGDVELSPAWQRLHADLLQELARLLDIDLQRLTELVHPQRPSAMACMAGLTVLSDWVSSDESRFAYRTHATATDHWWEASKSDAARAVAQLRLTAWKPQPATWAHLFPGTPLPRPAQRAVLEAAPGEQSLTILELDTGSGKTELALYLAHALAVRCEYHGIYFAQPTRAASEQGARRFRDFLGRALGDEAEANLAVVHGSAFASGVNEELLESNEDGPAALPARINLTSCSEDACEDAVRGTRVLLDEWFLAARRGLLSCFGIGTVDQIVLAAQRSRHWFLRLFGLANKVVVIDEAHAYEWFQQRLLGDAIGWLADAGASVIVLSATLPDVIRKDLVTAWTKGCQTTPDTPQPAGPVTFVTTTGHVSTLALPASRRTPRQRTRLLLQTDPGPEDLARTLLRQHSTGITGVIRNRVARATDLYRAARTHARELGWEPDEILLLHACFFERDRLRQQQRALRLLGPHPDPRLRTTHPNPHRPRRLLLIGTQVLEQSLDYCLDDLYTDLCPFDLLIQRRGRLWRHWCNRPHLRRSTPLMRVLTPASCDDGWPDFSPAASPPYDPYLLAATWHALNQRAPSSGAPLHLRTPEDTHPILQSIYASADGPEPIHARLRQLSAAWQLKLDGEDEQARKHSLPPYTNGVPCTAEELASGSAHDDGDDPGQAGYLAARSRLGTPGLHVVGLYQHPDRNQLTWDAQGLEPADLTRCHPRTQATAHRRQQRQILLNTVRVPHAWLSQLPHPSQWTMPEPGALRGKPVLLLDPSGRPLNPSLREHLIYQPDTGLSRTTREQHPASVSTSRTTGNEPEKVA
ncbi:CRISPR-associated helicase Cas3' [Streptomyces sp. NPDC046925]|uniref:CRISPR-associated helicase Cas3' n=1 Tax=Streptomyces sp. NPDC046925 TaxID=3155375 RepID=UPI0033CCA097